MCVCMPVLTDRVGVLMLKWSTRSDRLALLQPGLFKVTNIDTVYHIVYYCRSLLCLYSLSHLIHA